ncbi:MAG TPA: PP2C family protein-serine/threonine phosphatase, partial [Rickettsiales bacterium]|nr:PP2C family protein-serine/threonine phosphatase [Rickettsiales bacterium]
FCSVIAKKIGSDIQITTANLGDSRAVLVVSSKKMARNVAICLTEDHKPDLLRVRTYVESKGGRVLLGRVNGGLAVGAAIGDRLVVGEEQEDCLLRIPDIWQYNLSQYLKDLGFESCDDVTVDLITSCDGLFEEGITVDYERFLDKDNTIHNGYVAGQGVSIAEIISDWRENKAIQRVSPNLADYLTNKAISYGSGDNISAIVVPLIENGTMKLGDIPVMATVCDGHGITPIGVTQSADYDKSKKADGSVVAALAAAQLFVDAQSQEIVGTEIGEERDLMKKEIAELGFTPTVKTTPQVPTEMKHDQEAELVMVPKTVIESTSSNNLFKDVTIYRPKFSTEELTPNPEDKFDFSVRNVNVEKEIKKLLETQKNKEYNKVIAEIISLAITEVNRYDSSKIDNSDAIKFIIIAIKNQGFSNKDADLEKNIAEVFKDSGRDHSLLKTQAKLFSAIFQEICDEKGLLTGNQQTKGFVKKDGENPKLVGLRTKRINPESLGSLCVELEIGTGIIEGTLKSLDCKFADLFKPATAISNAGASGVVLQSEKVALL